MFEFSMALQHDTDRPTHPATHCSGAFPIQEVNYHFLEDEERWLGCLRKYPDFWAEGHSFAELEYNLRRLFFTLSLAEALKDGRIIQHPPIR